MALVTICLPDDLAEEARAAGLNLPGLTQAAVRSALAAQRTDEWLEDVASLPPTRIDHDEVIAAVDAAKGRA